MKILEVARKRSISLYEPHPKQRDFHDAGLQFRERVLMAGNQVGKTHAAGAETSAHLTGRYPKDWKGHRFTRPIKAWASGVTVTSTRDNPQRLLMGEKEQWGTGMIPEACLGKLVRARGLGGAIDHVQVRHVTGGWSDLQFKSYEQGRDTWQGETLDLIWFDEEPPKEIYSEGLARLTVNPNARCYITFTPLMGMTDVVGFFYPKPNSPDRFMVQMGIEDALHIDPSDRAARIAQYPEHEREARTQGIPLLGRGRIFPISRSKIEVEPFKIPGSWPQIIGMDFGEDHPTAACLLAWDEGANCVYLTNTYAASDTPPEIHAATIKRWGDWINVAWPHDGYRGAANIEPGVSTAEFYRTKGLRMLGEHATFHSGGYGLQASVTELLDRMQTGGFKAFKHLEDWWKEFHHYHRHEKTGAIVPRHDDIISSVRYALMMLRFARPNQRRTQVTVSPDWEPFSEGPAPSRSMTTY